MYRRILAVGLLWSLPISLSAQTHKGSLFTAIAFYNLENFFNPADNPDTDDEDFTTTGSHRYTEEVFRQKTGNMACVLSQLGTDLCPEGASVIGVCEVEDDYVLKSLVSHPLLSGRHYRFIRFDGPDKRGINVALIYRPDAFRMLQARNVPVDLRPAGGGFTRDILWVTGILRGDTVHLLVNHWPSRSGGEAESAPKRALAAAEAKQLIATISSKQPGARIILMGDLNDDPVSPSVAKVLGATSRQDKAGAALLYNPWVSFYENGYGTLCHNDHWNLFDQILLSPAWLSTESGHWQFYKAAVFDKDFLKTRSGRYRGYPHRSYNGNRWINGYSDHFPTIVYITR
ncbi:endonuclease/exonuclease/phosphatase family protein [Rurimicrobium arvi]